MFRSASRTLLRRTPASQQLRFAQTRRFLNTSAEPQTSRSWKSTAVRLGLAAGAVYFYQTSSVFADNHSLSLQPATSQSNEESNLPTIESVTAAKKQRTVPPKTQEQSPEPKPTSTAPDATAAATSPAPSPAENAEKPPSESESQDRSPSELQEEADQEGAFDPETGEINWDCPCLGGMAHGPCGEEFRTAFSCFVYSEEEPKGMDCIDKFKGMQDCFRLHPDIYGGEVDEEEVDEQLNEHVAREGAGEDRTTSVAENEPTSTSSSGQPSPKQVQHDVEEDLDPEDTIRVTPSWHDATQKNEEVGNEKEKKQ